ncbi:MAG: HAMP domain-containing protein [Nitrospirales bacterium]|nr:HAMP domain-containing protein [Nitrospirales bacterium]
MAFRSSIPFFRFSLRHKLTLFISLLIIGVWCTLSWYLIVQQARLIHKSLIDTRTILTERLASTSLFSVITRDTVSLSFLSKEIRGIPEIKYIRFLGDQGEVLFVEPETDLGMKQVSELNNLLRMESFIQTQDTSFRVIGKKVEPFDDHLTTTELLFMMMGIAKGETIFDVIHPIRAPELDPSLLQDLELTSLGAPSDKTLHGFIQIGISNKELQDKILSMAQQSLARTGFIILTALGVTILLAGRLVTTPLKNLASLTTKVAGGDLTVTVKPTTTDEIGELAQAFNHMISSLEQRDAALAHQIKRLSTINQIGTAIASSLDPIRVSDMVLELLVKNVGFQRTLLMLYDPERHMAFDARIAGVSQEVAEAACMVTIPIEQDGPLPSEILMKGKRILVADLEDIAFRMDPQLLQWARSMETTSLILAPLTSQQRILGFVGASRGNVPCTQEDLDLLSTIGSQVGVAIDNAQAYHQLETLMKNLDERVQERTEALHQANEELKELNRLKSAVVASVSHELRTPLASIKMHVDNALDGGIGYLSIEQRGSWNRVRNDTERLCRLTNNVLDLSRIESGHSTLALISVSLPEVVSKVADTLQPFATKNHLKLKVITPSKPIMVWADEDKLDQILVNLVHNALKFTPQGGGEVRIITEQGMNGYAQACVADTGNGVPPEDLENIFLPYYRSSLATVKNRGAGLGLAITKRLVEMHGGTLWVESTPNQGSRFFFTLPLDNAGTVPSVSQ